MDNKEKEERRCIYCKAITSQPDEDCYMAPKLPMDEPIEDENTISKFVPTPEAPDNMFSSNIPTAAGAYLKHPNGAIEPLQIPAPVNKSLSESPDKIPSAEFELEEIPVPVGNFIMENSEGIWMNDGRYYHYSEVCKLLKFYALLREQRAVEQAKEEWEKEKIELLKEKTLCLIRNSQYAHAIAMSNTIEQARNEVKDLKF